jgi:hypothetical protein
MFSESRHSFTSALPRRGLSGWSAASDVTACYLAERNVAPLTDLRPIAEHFLERGQCYVWYNGQRLHFYTTIAVEVS